MEQMLRKFPQKQFQIFMFFFIGILIIPVILYYMSGLFTDNSIFRASIAIGSVLVFKIGYVVFVMYDKDNFGEIDDKKNK